MWCGSPGNLIRAARHYERASAILMLQLASTSDEFATTQRCEPPPLGMWVRVSMPSRLDFAGGWSDNPPICYENGGATLTCAVLVDGKQPILVRVRRIAEHNVSSSHGQTLPPTISSVVSLNRPHLQVIFRQKARDAGGDDKTLVCRCLEDLADFAQAMAPCALLKAALICAGAVDLGAPGSLEEQLRERCGGGLEIEAKSDLPVGSGLGTSSILGGGLLLAISRARGEGYLETASLVHAVMRLEQLSDDDPGWMDQATPLKYAASQRDSQCVW